MKKYALLLLSTVAAAAIFTGCGVSFPSLGSAVSGSSDDASSSAASVSADASVGYADENGNADGGMGDTMHTYFFDYTVNNAYLCEEYEGYQPKDGKELLVADITVKNTFNSAIEMYDTDFQIQWNDDAEDAFDFPITAYLESGSVFNEEMLPDIYQLSVNETKEGLLVFEVPQGNQDFSISYLEQFDDDTTGDVFFVYFSAEKQ